MRTPLIITNVHPNFSPYLIQFPIFSLLQLFNFRFVRSRTFHLSCFIFNMCISYLLWFLLLSFVQFLLYVFTSFIISSVHYASTQWTLCLMQCLVSSCDFNVRLTPTSRWFVSLRASLHVISTKGVLVYYCICSIILVLAVFVQSALLNLTFSCVIFSNMLDGVEKLFSRIGTVWELM